MALNVVILAAGKGTRMRSDLPKVLHPIAHKSMVQHVIDTAHSIGSDAIQLVYGYGADKLKSALGEQQLNWMLQAEQLGTGHAVAQAIPNIDDNDTVLILYGDVPLIQASTLEALLAARPDNGVAILTVNLTNPTGYGRIVREQGKVVGIVEQKDANAEQLAINEINTGIMAVPGKALKPGLAVYRITMLRVNTISLILSPWPTPTGLKLILLSHSLLSKWKALITACNLHNLSAPIRPAKPKS